MWQHVGRARAARRCELRAQRLRGKRISLEFGSANPTGPLVVVQGRTLSIGDTLARAMRYCGYDVFVEWIINDAGSQMETLGASLYARYMQHFDPSFPFPEEGYPGEYLLPLAQRSSNATAKNGATVQPPPIAEFAKFGRDAIVAEQRATAERFGVHYDLWQSEKELHDNGRVGEDIDQLRELGLTYEADGALYFRTSQFGDDKDRVIVRSDGRPTYFAPDIAYHLRKAQPRRSRRSTFSAPIITATSSACAGSRTRSGYPGRLDVLIAQQITLMRGGEQVSMSKRDGNIITLDEILDEVGVDAARFFFTMLATDSPLTFDLKLAVEQSSENPVYYVQYGHARIASVLRKADPADVEAAQSRVALRRCRRPMRRSSLARRLAELPRVVHGVVEQSRAAPAHEIRARRRDRFPPVLHRLHDLGRRSRSAPRAPGAIARDEIGACASARADRHQRAGIDVVLRAPAIKRAPSGLPSPVTASHPGPALNAPLLPL